MQSAAPPSTLQVLCNAHTMLEGRVVTLAPYQPQMVPQYHRWMQDPWLREMTASEALSLEEEYANQASWRDDPTKLTFILCHPAPQRTTAAPAELAQCTYDSEDMIGDVNAFLKEDHDTPGDWIAELEVMVAEESMRRQGYALEALQTFMCFITRELTQVRTFMVKIGDQNTASLDLFLRLGFQRFKYVAVFKETELRCAVDAELVARLKRHWETTRVRRVTLGDPL